MDLVDWMLHLWTSGVVWVVQVQRNEREDAPLRQRCPGVESASTGGGGPQMTLYLLPNNRLVLRTSSGDFRCC